MATTSSTTSSAAASATTTGSIDVASIVAQLMTIENKPLDTLKTKITTSQAIISDLGSMKSKVSALQTALATFEDPSTYNNPSASTTNASVVTATANNAATIGSVSVSVSKLATSSQYVLTKSTGQNFLSATDTVHIDSQDGFGITVAGQTFNTKTTPLVPTGTDGATTVTDLKNWVNNLGVNVSANIIQTTSASDWVLQINGTQTGLANAVSINPGGTDVLNGGSAGSANPVAIKNTDAQDAVATIGGVTVNRASNVISDVVSGITFNLVGQSTGSEQSAVTVSQGADTSNAMINTLIKAYNDVITQYNTLTANSATSATPGHLANDPTILSFVNNIKSMFSSGAVDASNMSVIGFSSTADTVNIDKANGYLQVGSHKYQFSTIPQASPTVNDFITWINGLNVGISASAVTVNSQVSIAVKNTQNNTNTAIDFTGINSAASRKTTSLSSMGMDLQLDGTITFNTASYQTAVSNGLAGKLASGLNIGYAGAASNLAKFLTSEIDPASGALVNQIQTQQNAVLDLQKKQTELQDRLNSVQNNYITQYSALNALLFQLNSTSTSLASALTAITNINAGK